MMAVIAQAIAKHILFYAAHSLCFGCEAAEGFRGTSGWAPCVPFPCLKDNCLPGQQGDADDLRPNCICCCYCSNKPLTGTFLCPSAAFSKGAGQRAPSLAACQLGWQRGVSREGWGWGAGLLARPPQSLCCHMPQSWEERARERRCSGGGIHCSI